MKLGLPLDSLDAVSSSGSFNGALRVIGGDCRSAEWIASRFLTPATGCGDNSTWVLELIFSMSFGFLAFYAIFISTGLRAESNAHPVNKGSLTNLTGQWHSRQSLFLGSIGVKVPTMI